MRKPQTTSFKPLMMLLTSLLISSCIGPKVNTCIVDLNIVDRAIDAAAGNLSKEELKKLMHEVAPLYCVPPDAKDASKDFHLPLKTGQHVYTAEDWGILMRWVEDHTK